MIIYKRCIGTKVCDLPSIIPPPTVPVHSSPVPRLCHLSLSRGETFPDSLPETTWLTPVDGPVKVAEMKATWILHPHLYVISLLYL